LSSSHDDLRSSSENDFALPPRIDPSGQLLSGFWTGHRPSNLCGTVAFNTNTSPLLDPEALVPELDATIGSSSSHACKMEIE
jgi:hypothetical protein